MKLLTDKMLDRMQRVAKYVDDCMSLRVYTREELMQLQEDAAAIADFVHDRRKHRTPEERAKRKRAYDMDRDHYPHTFG